jgi:glycosyltransferase involved in cell wall biosynthesis
MKQKVLFVLDSFPGPHGGTESQFWLLINGLDRTRFEPTILLMRASPYLEKHAGDIPVRVIDVPRLKSLRGIARVMRAAAWARRAGFKLAHIFFNDSAVAFPLPLRLAGLRVVVGRRDLGFWYSRSILAVLRIQARFVAAVVANSAAVRAAVTKAEGFATDTVRIIYNGLQRRRAAVTEAVRARFGIPEGAPLIVVVANLRPLKRVADVVRALAQLPADSQAAHLLVVGEDREGERGTSHRAELESLANSLGVFTRLHFAGQLEDPMPVVLQADVGVLASDTEGLSNAIIEYMAASKPVVASNVGGNGELVEHGETGYLFAPRDVAALAKYLDLILRDPAHAAALGSAGGRRAARLFTPEAMIEQHQALYDELLAIDAPAASR